MVVDERRDFRSYHAFLRSARNYMEGPLVEAMHANYQRVIAESGRPQPTMAASAEPILERITEFQLYSWYFRNLQRFKYSYPDLGIFAAVGAQRVRLAPALSTPAEGDGEELRLEPKLQVPEYFKYVPFHQHTGGVADDELDGIFYEIGRRTTTPAHSDPDAVYQLLFDALPRGRAYPRVLDWGVGHGAALIAWQELHAESECFGVDLSAPCLRPAHRRAKERHMRLFLSQQDLEHLDFPIEYFDLVFFNYMLHEFPATNIRALLTEVFRILKPGGLFAGHELALRSNDPFQNVLQISRAWLNNEPYAAPWYSTPIADIARAVGFSSVRIEPFAGMLRTTGNDGRKPSADYWNLYIFER